MNRYRYLDDCGVDGYSLLRSKRTRSSCFNKHTQGEVRDQVNKNLHTTITRAINPCQELLFQETISILPSLMHFESFSNYRSSSSSNKNLHTIRELPFQETIQDKLYSTLTPAVRILFSLQSSLSSLRLRSCRLSPILTQSTILRRAANIVF